MEENVELSLDEAIDATGAEVFDSIEKSEAAQDRPRDESGRFLSTKEEVEEEVETEEFSEEEGEEIVADDTEEVEDQDAAEEGEDVVTAPRSWSASEREFFNSLAPEEQKTISEIVTRREGDMEKALHSKMQELGDKSSAYEVFNQVFEPRRNGSPANPQAEAQYLNDVLSTLDFAKSNPEGFLSWFAQQSNIDLDTFEPQDQPRVDPALQQTQQMVWQLQNQIAQMQQPPQQDHKATIAEFSKDREFFNDVRSDMADLIEAGAAQTMEEAYEKAIWSNEDTRKVLLDREAKEKANKKVEVAKNAKKKAKTNIKASTARRTATPKSDNLDDLMDAIGEEIFANAAE